MDGAKQVHWTREKIAMETLQRPNPPRLLLVYGFQQMQFGKDAFSIRPKICITMPNKVQLWFCNKYIHMQHRNPAEEVHRF